jgi:hypothetical protein
MLHAIFYSNLLDSRRCRLILRDVEGLEAGACCTIASLMNTARNLAGEHRSRVSSSDPRTYDLTEL